MPDSADDDLPEPLLRRPGRYEGPVQKHCMHPLDATFLICFICVVFGVFLAAGLVTMAVAVKGGRMAAEDYFPLQGEASKLTWAHAVNSREQLEEAIEDGKRQNELWS